MSHFELNKPENKHKTSRSWDAAGCICRENVELGGQRWPPALGQRRSACAGARRCRPARAVTPCAASANVIAIDGLSGE